MIFREFGATARELPVVGQGTWHFPPSGQAVEEAKLALKIGIQSGMRHIDTAEMYGSGRSEEIVGEAIQGLPRQELFIVSKVLPANASYKGTIQACEASLRRLKLDYLDCYLLHWRGSFPLSETMRAMEYLVQAGKIRSLGVSNFDVYDLEEAAKCLSKEPIACNQVLYNLGERGIERRLIPYCQKHRIAVVGYTPFGNFPQPGTAAGEALRQIADKHGCTQRQVALSFVIRAQNLFTIPKAANIEHARENAAAAEVQLDQEDLDLIDASFPVPKRDVPLATG